MADDTISTRQDTRAEARLVFDDMRRILERILEDEDLNMGVDLSREIDTLLDRAASARRFF